MKKRDGGGLPKGTIFEFEYTGSAQQIELPKGTYLLEVWGARSGEYSNSGSGGKGGYSKGIINIRKGVFLNCYIGGLGGGASSSGGWNGGGNSRSYGASGGGGTDIRINSDSLYSRVIVAGGGGGNGYGSARPGGHGGGLNGIQGTSGTNSGGGGGTQTNGGSGSGGNGIFGSAVNSSSNGGAGGGGWYGGGAGSGGSTDSAGGGGSGYIHTPDSHKPEGWLLTEEHFLTDAETIAGNQTMPNPTGGTQIGHTGNGYARITVV